MKLKTIGCVELNSVCIGMKTADEMLKSAHVELVIARPTCPGRYIIVVTGDTGAVQNAVEVGEQIAEEMLIDSFVIANIHESVIPALSGVALGTEINALGLIETYTSAAGILAADAAAKAANIELLEIRFAAGLAGKAYIIMTGEVSSVQASVDAGVKGVGLSGPVHSHVVIASPSAELKAQILS